MARTFNWKSRVQQRRNNQRSPGSSTSVHIPTKYPGLVSPQQLLQCMLKHRGYDWSSTVVQQVQQLPVPSGKQLQDYTIELTAAVRQSDLHSLLALIASGCRYVHLPCLPLTAIPLTRTQHVSLQRTRRVYPAPGMQKIEQGGGGLAAGARGQSSRRG